MLVLSRKMHERIIIGQGIEVTVLAISGNRVCLGINAPPEVAILRQELERDANDVSFRPQGSRSEAASQVLE